MSNEIAHGTTERCSRTGWTFALHLAPGVVLLPVYTALAYAIHHLGGPAVLALYVALVLVLIPYFVLILGKTGPSPWWTPLPVRTVIRLSALTLAWAIFVFAAVDPIISEPIRDRLFFWVPEWFEFAGQYHLFGGYSRAWRVSTWAVGLVVGSITVPVLEELYFRGYLLPRLDHLGRAAPVINTVLFALYHVTQPWLVPTRAVATFPLFYVTWKQRSIIPAIVVHVALNLVGDTILSIPVVFS